MRACVYMCVCGCGCGCARRRGMTHTRVTVTQSTRYTHRRRRRTSHQSCGRLCIRAQPLGVLIFLSTEPITSPGTWQRRRRWLSPDSFIARKIQLSRFLFNFCTTTATAPPSRTLTRVF